MESPDHEKSFYTQVVIRGSPASGGDRTGYDVGSWTAPWTVSVTRSFVRPSFDGSVPLRPSL